MRFKKIIIAIKFHESSFAALEEIKKLNISELTEVQFVHMVPVNVYGGLQVTVSTYPPEEEHARIEETIKQELRQLSLALLPGHEKTLIRCMFSTNVKESFNEYIQSEHADLVVIPLKERSGILKYHDSSFAQFMMRHASADVLLLKNRRAI